MAIANGPTGQQYPYNNSVYPLRRSVWNTNFTSWPLGCIRDVRKASVSRDCIGTILPPLCPGIFIQFGVHVKRASVWPEVVDKGSEKGASQRREGPGTPIATLNKWTETLNHNTSDCWSYHLVCMISTHTNSKNCWLVIYGPCTVNELLNQQHNNIVVHVISSYPTPA